MPARPILSEILLKSNDNKTHFCLLEKLDDKIAIERPELLMNFIIKALLQKAFSSEEQGQSTITIGVPQTNSACSINCSCKHNHRQLIQ